MRKIGRSHKTFATKHSFPSKESERTKSPLPDKMALNAKYITKIRKVGVATEYNNIQI